MLCPASPPAFNLTLSGNHWHIRAGDITASPAVAAFGEAMSLSPAGFRPDQFSGGQWQELVVFADSVPGDTPNGWYESGPFFCLLPPPENDDLLTICMSLIGLAIARAELSRGGILIHGALAVMPDYLEGGIILAGQAAAGKTTASNRLPPAWHSLSDDTSLVVRDNFGQYIAYPWPTWSRFFRTEDGKPGPGGKWDVSNGVPLQAIFFLDQAIEDRISTLPPTTAVTYLMDTIQLVSSLMTRDLPENRVRALHEKQLRAAEDLAFAISTYMLHLSLTGTFWKKIEEKLALDSRTSPVRSGNVPANNRGPQQKVKTPQSFLFDNAILAVSYTGSSMNPTLRHPDLLEVLPYSGQPIRPGDVTCFHSPADGLKVIHRVVRVTTEGISTRGDNNYAEDPYLLQHKDIIGRVIAAWRYGKRREIYGGLSGICYGYSAMIRGRLNNYFSYILYRTYHSLSAKGMFRYLLPSSFQPRVYEFKQRYMPSILKLMVKGHVIGHYDVLGGLWKIERPWRLVVDEENLPIMAE